MNEKVLYAGPKYFDKPKPEPGTRPEKPAPTYNPGPKFVPLPAKPLIN